jgi:preprotein translocase SecE subunit
MAIVEKVSVKDNIETNFGLPIDTKNSLQTNKKPANFLTSLFNELKQVEWPSPKYVVNWCVLIIIFTSSFALIMGTLDHYFKASIKYASCVGESKNSCVSDLIDDALFRNGF